MAGPVPNSPQGNKPVMSDIDQKILDAMMADLGNDRLEELATDNSSGRPRGRQNPPADHHSTPMQQGGGRGSNPLAGDWKSAFDRGEFQDDDYHQVKNLDSLDDGNAHRQNRGPHAPGRAYGGNGAARSRQIPNAASQAVGPTANNGAKRMFRVYDPSNPGYPKNSNRQSSQPLGNGYTQTAHGIVLQPGQEVKRWDPKQAGPSGTSSPSVTVSQTAGMGPSVGRSAGYGALLSVGLQQAARMSGGGGGGGGGPQGARESSMAVAQGYTPSSAVQRQLPIQQPGVPSPTLTVQRHAGQATQGSVALSGATTDAKILGTGTSGKPLLPHQRRGPYVPNVVLEPKMPDPTPQIPKPLTVRPKTISTPAATSAPTGSEGNVLSNRLAQGIAPFEPGRVLFQGRADVILIVGQDKGETGARASVYEQNSQGGIVVWEVVGDDGRVLRGDVRLCLSLCNMGSSVHLRRQDHPASAVRSTHIRFLTIPMADGLAKLLNHHKMRQLVSQEPRFEETLEGSRSVEQLPCTQAGGADNANLTEKPEAPTQMPKSLEPDFTVEENMTDPGETLEVGFGTSPSVRPNLQAQAETCMLIDLGAPGPPEGASVRSETLADLQYHIAPTANTQVLNASAPNSLALGSPALDALTLDTSALNPPSSLTITHLMDEVDAATRVLADVEATETICHRDGLAQTSLRILSFLTEDEYSQMTQTSRAIVELLGRLSPDVSRSRLLKHVVVMLAALQLMRYDGFRALQTDEQKKTLAVVYANVVHGNDPIIRSANQLHDLRSNEAPCPNVVYRFTAYVRSQARRVSPAVDTASQLSHDTISTQGPVEEKQRSSDEEKKHVEKEGLAVSKKKAGPAETTRMLNALKAFVSSREANSSQAASNGGPGPTHAIPRAESSRPLALRDLANPRLAPQSYLQTAPSRSPSPASPAYEMSSSLASSPRATATQIPRTTSANASSTAESGPPKKKGLSASRWAQVPRPSTSSQVSRNGNHGGSPNRGRSDTGDLSSLSGLNGQFRALNLGNTRRG
ncbi:hypothetical protein F4677DRAFT_465066 [Hypoxylon crocopeplum]|nr:hypothetical protein F4677DRAFT_465066 [Hypoxylon crocopeplum]